jgi:Stress responsive A/B Barrel Domain
MITHIVLFKLTDPRPDIVDATRELLLSMNGNVPQLRHLEVGIDLIHSERSCDIALVTRFDSLDELKAYQVDPYHAGTILPHMRSVCSSIVSVDYDSP